MSKNFQLMPGIDLMFDNTLHDVMKILLMFSIKS
jgi:hypothetical protein